VNAQKYDQPLEVCVDNRSTWHLGYRYRKSVPSNYSSERFGPDREAGEIGAALHLAGKRIVVLLDPVVCHHRTSLRRQSHDTFLTSPRAEFLRPIHHHCCRPHSSDSRHSTVISSSGRQLYQTLQAGTKQLVHCLENNRQHP
jgi:hypothetical protein